MDDKNWIQELSGSFQISKIIELNNLTKEFGLTISEEEAIALVKEKKYSLREKQRVEFGEGILAKLIVEFCDSPFIYQDNFTETIVILQDIFYEYKNESMDELTDDELIEFMKKAFNGECQGSIEYLEETILEKFARDIRERGQNFLEHYYKVRDILDE